MDATSPLNNPSNEFFIDPSAIRDSYRRDELIDLDEDQLYPLLPSMGETAGDQLILDRWVAFLTSKSVPWMITSAESNNRKKGTTIYTLWTEKTVDGESEDVEDIVEVESEIDPVMLEEFGAKIESMLRTLEETGV